MIPPLSAFLPAADGTLSSKARYPWVSAGVFTARRLWDGVTVWFDGEQWWASVAVPLEEPRPHGFRHLADRDGHAYGWIPAANHPRGAHIYEAMYGGGTWLPGLYELIGPESVDKRTGQVALPVHTLARHDQAPVATDFPATLTKARQYLAKYPGKGVVLVHADGTKVLIQRTDVGHEWPIEKKSGTPLK